MAETLKNDLLGGWHVLVLPQQFGQTVCRVESMDLGKMDGSYRRSRGEQCQYHMNPRWHVEP